MLMTKLTPEETRYVLSTLEELKTSEHFNADDALTMIHYAMEILTAAYDNAQDEPIRDRREDEQ